MAPSVSPTVTAGAKNTRGNRLTRERGQTDEQTDRNTSWGRQWPSAELAEG